MFEERTYAATGRRDWLKGVVLVLAVIVLAILTLACEDPDPAIQEHDSEAHSAPAPESEHAAGEMAAGEMAPEEMMIDSRKQQLIGVTYGTVVRRDVDQTIRAVGVVAYDEKRLTDVTLKFGGWIEDLYVDETGELVKKGQELFTLYSPELISTQEDYLTAYDHFHRIKDSENREAIEGAGRLLSASRQRLGYWDIEEVHWKDLERDRKVLRALPIHSPASGYVIEKDDVAGAHVPAGRRLYRLADLDRVWVLADIYEYELPQVAVGQHVEVTLSYLPGEAFQGKVTYVYPYLQANERTVKIRIELTNPGHRLKEGMYADVTLSSRRADVLMVPTAAVIDSGTRQIVFLDLGDGRFEPRAVKLGARFDDGYEILEGIEVGDRIVTSANFLIDSESQLAAGMGQMQH